MWVPYVLLTVHLLPPAPTTFQGGHCALSPVSTTFKHVLDLCVVQDFSSVGEAVQRWVDELGSVLTSLAPMEVKIHSPAELQLEFLR